MKEKRKGAKTRAMIIENSLQLFSAKGYHNTSINDILNATNLTKGGLYAHFPGKESIWDATYEKAIAIWRYITFKDIREITDPLKRIQTLIERHLRDYIGGEVFKGGDFFLNMLIEFAGQSEDKTKHILRGFSQLSKLLESWIDEAKQNGLLREDINAKELGSFIVTSFYGTSALYAASRDPEIWKQTMTQLLRYIDSLKQ
ncbi:MAG: TetR/AcrR family transcriptional regulator [Syntrophobacterales bacterium]|jgi:AcrR family transcriptional regulator